MLDTDFEQQAIWIEEILEEAAKFGLRWEVETWAAKFMESDPDMDIIDAYNNAYNEWIK